MLEICQSYRTINIIQYYMSVYISNTHYSIKVNWSVLVVTQNYLG